MIFQDDAKTAIRDNAFIDITGDSKSYYVAENMTIHHGSDDIDLSPLLRVISPSAGFDSGEQMASCLPGTRKSILKDVWHWINAGADAHQGRLCWLRGPAGAGKTAVAHTLAAACTQRKLLAASYFFARDRPERNTVNSLIPTLAYQLSLSIPEIRPLIVKSLRTDPAISSKSISTQIRSLLIEPFQNLDAQPGIARPNLVVIDGVDECKDAVTKLPLLIMEHALPLRFLIVSRPEPDIKAVLFSHYEIKFPDPYEAKHDIEIYLKSELSKIASSPVHSPSIKRANKIWPPDRSVKLLAERSGGCFIYASTSLKYISDPNASPITQLNAILKGGSPASSAAFAELDKLYTQILSSSPKPDLLIRILGVILVLRKQKEKFLHLSLIAEILRVPPDQLSLALRGMHSLIYHDPDDLYSEVYPHHISFSDFLFDSNRSRRFYVDPRRAHYEVIKGSLLCMKHRGEQRSIFTMHYEHYGLLNYINDHLVWHFHRAEEHLLKATELIKQSRENIWIPANYTADYRFDDPGHASKIICLLHDALQLAKLRGSHYHALVDHFHKLRDTAFRRFLVAKSDTERLLIHAIVTLYEHASKREHHDKIVFKLLQLENSVTPSFLFIYSIVSDAIHGQHSPEASDMTLSSSLQLKEDMRDWLVDRTRSRNVFLDPKTTHAYLAHGCMALLASEPKASSPAFRFGMKNRDPVDTYARRYWAKHVSHASPGDPKLLKQLRNIDRKFLFSAEYIESIDLDDDSFLQHFCFCGSSSTVGRGSQHSHQCLSTFRKQDYFKAKAVLDWLKLSPHPSSDLINLWESYCEEKEWDTELDAGDDDDIYTTASHSSDDSSYLNHFREWWRHLGD